MSEVLANVLVGAFGGFLMYVLLEVASLWRSHRRIVRLEDALHEVLARRVLPPAVQRRLEELLS